MRDVVPVLLAALGVLILGALAWVLFFGTGEQSLVVDRVEGEVSRLGSGGGTNPARSGDVVLTGDRLVAGPDGRAWLALGDQTRLVLEPESSIRLKGQDENGIKVELEGGRVQATVRPGGASVGISAGDREITARDADLRVSREGGVFGAEVDRGSVELSGFGAATALGEGERMVAAPGAEPLLTDAERALLLAVEFPGADTREERVTVRGRTEPGARVSVGAVETRADDRGDFELTVPLAEGENALEVRARDALGNEARASWQVSRDSRPPVATEIVVGAP